MMICIDGEACHPSVDLKGPDSLPTWHRKHSAAVGGVQSDLTTQTFSVLLQPSSTSDFLFLFFLFRTIALFSLLFLLSLQWFVSRSSFVFVLRISSGLMATELNQDPWSNLLFTLSTALPTPLHCFTASLCSPPLPLFFSLFSPSLSPPFHILAGLPPCDIQSIGTGMDDSPCTLFPLWSPSGHCLFHQWGLHTQPSRWAVCSSVGCTY